MTGADAIAIIVLLTILVAVGVYLLHWLLSPFLEG